MPSRTQASAVAACHITWDKQINPNADFTPDSLSPESLGLMHRQGDGLLLPRIPWGGDTQCGWYLGLGTVFCSSGC